MGWRQGRKEIDYLAQSRHSMNVYRNLALWALTKVGTTFVSPYLCPSPALLRAEHTVGAQ